MKYSQKILAAFVLIFILIAGRDSLSQDTAALATPGDHYNQILRLLAQPNWHACRCAQRVLVPLGPVADHLLVPLAPPNRPEIVDRRIEELPAALAVERRVDPPDPERQQHRLIGSAAWVRAADV